MKQKLILFFILTIVLVTPKEAVAYDFSAVAPSGQTLYFKIVGGNAQVTYPLFSNHDYYYGYTKPTGNLSIPDSVLYGGNTYSVTSIGDRAFYGCSGLASITIPNSVTSIDTFAFYGCSGLLSVTIPKFVTYLGFFAFGNCSNLTIVNFNADSCVQAGYADDYGNNSTVFSGCTNLSTINFGNNVTSIPSFLCYDLRGIATVNIPDSVTKIGDYAFSNCRGLTSVSIGNSVTNIGNYAFSNCRWLTSVTIPNFVTSIGKGAFKGCSGLTTVYFNAECCVKAGYASSGNGFPVFGNCTNFSTIKFGNNVTSIPSHLCYGCVGLTDIEIPDSIITVGTAAFKECDHLTNIILGTGLSTIEDFAFYGCIQMVRIKSKLSSPPTVYANTFLGLNDDVILNVPCDAANEYENAAYWFRFNIQEDIMYDFYATSSNPARGTVTIITEPTCDYREAQVQANAYHGYHFDHWSDGNTDNPRYIVVLQDTLLVAYFASDNGEDEGIEETEEEKVKLYQRNGQIVVEGAEGYTVCLYDVVGRLLATRRETAQEVLLDVPESGAYLVKIGDAPARRIVVRR